MARIRLSRYNSNILWQSGKGRPPARECEAQSRKKEHKMARRKYSRNEKIFYVISLLIVASMVLSTIVMAITPGA